MGIFDRFKKSNQRNTNIQQDGPSKLLKAIVKLSTSQDHNTIALFAKVLKEYVENGTWVPMPVFDDKEGFSLNVLQQRGKNFAVIYSDNSQVHLNGNLLMTDIKKAIETVFSRNDIDGIIIDPETNSLCLEKVFLLKCILHDYLPEQNNVGSPQRNWGIGIPRYSSSDLMSKGEMLNFAMHTVIDNDEILNGYRPISACDNTDAKVNLIYESEGQFVLIKVMGYCAENAPTLSTSEKEELKTLCHLFGARAYYAPVGFRSATDIERFNACLALKGDGFYAKYEGLEELD